MEVLSPSLESQGQVRTEKRLRNYVESCMDNPWKPGTDGEEGPVGCCKDKKQWNVLGCWGNCSIERTKLVMQDRGLVDGVRSLRREKEMESAEAWLRVREEDEKPVGC